MRAAVDVHQLKKFCHISPGNLELSCCVDLPLSAQADPAAVRPGPCILVVEDDPDIRSLIARYLIEQDLRVLEAGSGPEMDSILSLSTVDLIVLDVNLPGEDGFDICLRIRQNSGPPVVMLTARGEDIDRVLGLELGADDYVTKPFNPRELLARIRAVLRRSAPDTQWSDANKTVLQFEGFRLDLRRRHLFDPGGARVVLTGSEFEVLRALLEKPGRVLSREELRAAIAQSSQSNDRSIDIIVSRLRQKIEVDARDPVLVQTIRSAGYVFTADVTRP